MRYPGSGLSPRSWELQASLRVMTEGIGVLENDMHIVAEPLTAVAFAPYGDVLEASEKPGRVYFKDALGNLRPHAGPSLSVTHATPLTALPLTATLLERHEFSSQSFLPFDVARWIVIVTPKAAGGGP